LLRAGTAGAEATVQGQHRGGGSMRWLLYGVASLDCTSMPEDSPYPSFLTSRTPAEGDDAAVAIQMLTVVPMQMPTPPHDPYRGRRLLSLFPFCFVSPESRRYTSPQTRFASTAPRFVAPPCFGDPLLVHASTQPSRSTASSRLD
jgi:hypothetical protein